MRFFIKTKYLIFILLIFLFSAKEVFAKEDKILYSKQNISNYLSGIVLLSQNKIEDSFKYLDKVNLLEDKHDAFNVQYIRTLVLLGKFDKAIDFSKSVWKKENFYFEADLLIGLDYFIKEDYVSAEKYFSRLNKISKYNLIFDDFFGNIFISWIKAIEGNKNDSFKFLDDVPEHFDNLKLIQESFLQCYFDSDKTPEVFEKFEEPSYDGISMFLALMKRGTSDPSEEARDMSSFLSIFRFQIFFSAIRVVAALELAPPRPDPNGIFLINSMFIPNLLIWYFFLMSLKDSNTKFCFSSPLIFDFRTTLLSSLFWKVRKSNKLIKCIALCIL